MFFQAAMELGCREVGVYGKEKRSAASVDVGDIYTAVGADQAMPRFGNQHASFATHDFPALLQS
jgi:hypothetical protein